MDHGTIAKGLAEQDSLVEKGHRVLISLKAALVTWQRHPAGGSSQTDVSMARIKVRI